MGTKFPKTRVSASVYPLLMEQALVNLVDNAVKFSPAESKVSVVLKLDKETQREAEIRVDDEGPGIPEVDKPRIFERFYRTEKGRTTPGTGLGLAIVKHIVNLHRGTVTVESPVPGTDVGTRFTLRFPLS